MCVSISVFLCISLSVFLSYSNLGHNASPWYAKSVVKVTFVCVSLSLSFSVFLSLSLSPILIWSLCLPLVCKKCGLGDVCVDVQHVTRDDPLFPSPRLVSPSLFPLFTHSQTINSFIIESMLKKIIYSRLYILFTGQDFF